ncbi:rRNA adenine N(6)-methyltransferase family protein [Candidatus Dojkabacteria bacterium]|nr:rRNA adenine N(6)-methyltransferase family protein [Candidatus Dojkabacteria bacterium]
MRKLQHSQNFIRSEKLISFLVEKANIGKNDIILEIGTGTGTITERLCEVAKKVISLEKDQQLFKIARKRLSKFPNLELVNEDFFNYHLPFFSYKCFSNIPFNFTADIIRRLLFSKNSPEEAYLFLQEEAAKRFQENSQVSLFLSPLFLVKILYEFKSNDFYPVPSVDIVLVLFKKRSPPDIDKKNYALYRDFITYCYNGWNKSLKKILQNIFTYKQLNKLTRELKFSLSNIPTEVDYIKWLGLFRFIETHPTQVKMDVFKSYFEIHKKKHKQQVKLFKTRN